MLPTQERTGRARAAAAWSKQLRVAPVVDVPPGAATHPAKELTGLARTAAAWNKQFGSKTATAEKKEETYDEYWARIAEENREAAEARKQRLDQANAEMAKRIGEARALAQKQERIRADRLDQANADFYARIAKAKTTKILQED